MIERSKTNPAWLDGEPLNPASIELSPSEIQQAAAVSHTGLSTAEQWQIYLNRLALTGFKQWLSSWAPDLTINDSQCSVFQSQYAHLINAACNLHIGSFTACLVVTSHADTVVDVPRAVIELSQFIPHFYILVEVLEELMQVQIYGYLRYDQFIKRQQSEVLSVNPDWTYTLPHDWFILDSNALMLELRYLEPHMTALPTTATIASPKLVPIAPLQAKLAALSSQLQSSKDSLNQFLTWEEAATLLIHPELLETLNSIDSPVIHGLSSHSAASISLSQQAIEVGLWLQGQLDRLAQELSWVLMPPFTFAGSALRSTVQEFDTIASELASRGIILPIRARGAYHDIHQDGLDLRLYAVTWIIPTTDEALDEAPEWALLLVLGTRSRRPLPVGIRLQIRDATQLLAEQMTAEHTRNGYLCIQVAGTWDEQLQVTIDLGNDTVIQFPPFAFAFNPAE